MAEINRYNKNSTRAKYARLGRALGVPLISKLLFLIFLLALVFGGILVFSCNSLGWLAIGVADLLLVLLIYINLLFKKVPLGKTEDINDILSSNILSILGSDPTPSKIAKSLIETRSGRFLALRFGIIPRLLEGVANDLPDDMTPIFKTARKIAKKINASQISGGIIAIAIIENHPNCEEILSRMRLDLNDLYEGITWYNYLHGLVKNSKKKRRDGGIARDFTFGFTPLLSRFGQNISASRSGTMKTQLFRASNQEALTQMVDIFSKSGRQNVALIGPDGSGRSTIVNAFSELLLDANSKISKNLKYRQIFKLDAGALLSGTTKQGDIERLVTELLNEAYSAKNIIIYLNNAHLFFEDGVGSVNISNLLLPVIEAGRLRMILSLDEQKFLEISAKNPSFANALNKIMVGPSSEEETIKIMEDQVPFLEFKHKVTFTYWALKEAYRLGDRYVKDLAMPGKAIRVLEDSARYAKDGLVFGESVSEAIEKSEGIKLQASTDTFEEKDKLLNLENLIHERMIDQEPAVHAVSDALRRAATGVRNENKPIGTYLFLGPTGVGKTELAKALSSVYFNGESEIIRIDMNEYVESSDVNRLIAEGSSDAMSLTAQVQKHPFSVVLLDEIEKASPQVLTTLLQMLDEGILRDTKNREISFRDAIIICTSNAGADIIREKIRSGENYETLRSEIINSLIENRDFKPEFLNRFDEICLFKPLSKDDLIKICDLLIAGVNKTLSPQKISVSLEPEAKELLIEAGYDPLLGARPMRRIVSKTVENIVAKASLRGEISSGSTLNITKAKIEEELK
ncbi:ATP-dependent Clp protease ATP-binding subunit [Candidatus Saccharibacteria bacterium]|nr:ATP-dependent Clp protease ATP-binding subunit [Candidatus Saccharibacteria bacterium]